jgi:hypothetical protein
MKSEALEEKNNTPSAMPSGFPILNSGVARTIWPIFLIMIHSEMNATRSK